MRREAFEQFATLDREHWWFRGRRVVYLGLLARELGGKRPARALDLGCGPGGFVPGLLGLCESVIAADEDLESLQSAKAREDIAGCAPSVATTARRLPFKSGCFDLVCLYDVLEHIEDEPGALREIRRVLAPSGVLAMSVPAYPWLFSNNDRVAMHCRRYTRASLHAALERAGFEVSRNTHANVLLTPVIVPLTLIAKALEATLLSGRTAQHTNLSWPLPRFAHALLERVFACELRWTARWDARFGHSIAAIARRTESGPQPP